MVCDGRDWDTGARQGKVHSSDWPGSSHLLTSGCGTHSILQNVTFGFWSVGINLSNKLLALALMMMVDTGMIHWYSCTIHCASTLSSFLTICDSCSCHPCCTVIDFPSYNQPASTDIQVDLGIFVALPMSTICSLHSHLLITSNSSSRTVNSHCIFPTVALLSYLPCLRIMFSFKSQIV
jgi:hypothetical protein